MGNKDVLITFRAQRAAKDMASAEARAEGESLSNYILSATLKENAARAANRAGLPSHNQVAAEDYQRRFWFCGNPASPDDWPARDEVLEAMGPEFGNRDFRASLFAELAVRRPEISGAAYTAHKLGVDPDPLIEAAFEDFFSAEPEAAYDAFSVSDTTRFLIGETLGWENVLAANNNNHGQLLEYHFSEADRAGVAGRRAHSRRVLRQWREAGIPWPTIEVFPGGARIADNVHLKFRTEGGRRVPFFSTAPADDTAPKPVLSEQQAVASGLKSSPIGGTTRERPRTRNTIGGA